jgi:type IV pilus assembly protein PilE
MKMALTLQPVRRPERSLHCLLRLGSPLRARGFTLTEMVIAVAIAAILASIAIPSYQGMLIKSRRADAKVALEDLANRLERYYADFNTYVGAPLSNTSSPKGYYALSFTTASSATNFTIQATRVATGPQANDTICGDFTLDQDENKGIVNGSGTVAECW